MLEKVTVIIPCYNHANFVERAILSVYEQTYLNIELIVVDDGSTDSSLSVLVALRERLGFVLVVQENRGVCKTLNRAIKDFAHGKYIALLASDDFWRSDKLELQINSIIGNPGSEFCFSQAFEFINEYEIQKGKVFPRKCLSGQILNHVFIRQHVPAGTMLFTRRLYDVVGGFDESLKEEDWDFVIRCAAVTSFVSVNKPLLYYRSHAENTMKLRGRNNIFQQKAMILSKNFHLVVPIWWVLAIFVHFVYDLIYKKYFK